MGQSIEVWLNDSKTIILKADYPGHRVPSGRDYATKTFLVRLVMLERGLQIVEYVNQDGTLMAVRAPRPTCKGKIINYITDFLPIFTPLLHHVKKIKTIWKIQQSRNTFLDN